MTALSVMEDWLGKAIALHKHGDSWASIARSLNVSRNTVSRVLNALGFSSTPGGKPKYTKQQADGAIDLFQKGLSMAAIGRQLGIDDQLVRRLLDRAGVTSPGKRLIPRYSAAMKAEAIRLYVDERMSSERVAKRLGLKVFTVKEWVSAAGVIRSMSEAAALAIARGKKRGRSLSHHLWHSAKTGAWHMADSTYEVVRMRQLDEDPKVLSWDLCRRRIQYIHPISGAIKHYVPDIEIVGSDGVIRVEEIKPSCFVSDPVNLAKADAAQAYFSGFGIRYSIVTEQDIGVDQIAAYAPTGFQAFTEDVKNERERLTRRNALERRLAAETPEQRRIRLDRDAEKARARRALKKKSYSASNTCKPVQAPA